MSSRTKSFIALVAVTTIPSLAAAGTYVESVVTNLVRSQAPPQTIKLWAGDGRIRMEMQNGEIVQIFRDRVFYTLNAADKSFTKLDKAGFDALAQQADEFARNLEAQLPPEEQAKLKQKQAAGKPQFERTLQPTTRTEATAMGQTCKVWEVISDGNKVQELCVVEVAKLPNGKELIATMQQVGEAFAGGTASAGMTEIWRDVKTMNGYPLITRTYFTGKLIQEVKTTSMRVVDTPETLFTIPAGFKERKMGEIGKIGGSTGSSRSGTRRAS